MPTITTQKIAPCLWFDGQAEQAAQHYISIFPDSTVVEVQRYGPDAPMPQGTAMTVTFELAGQRFMALNGGPEFSFTEAISFHVSCSTQEEVDELWTRLSEAGQEGPCGWLKDRFGVSWQIIPEALPRLLADPDPDKANRVLQAMFAMKKIEVSALEKAYAEAG